MLSIDKISIFACSFLVILVPASRSANVDGDLHDPSIAYDPDTGYYLSVSSGYDSIPPAGHRIKGSVLDVAREVVNSFVIYEKADNFNPSLVYDSRNHFFLIVWAPLKPDLIEGIDDHDIYGKYVKLYTDGTHEFNPNILLTIQTLANNDFDYIINWMIKIQIKGIRPIYRNYNPLSGTFVVVWEDDSDGGTTAIDILINYVPPWNPFDCGSPPVPLIDRCFGSGRSHR